MIFLLRRATRSWRAGSRARLLYTTIGAAFGGLAVVAAISGNAAVAALAVIAGIVTLGLAVIAPRLSAPGPGRHTGLDRMGRHYRR